MHEDIRDLMALSAAGLLDAAGERRVLEHARECPECAARLEEIGALARGLRSFLRCGRPPICFCARAREWPPSGPPKPSGDGTRLSW